MPLVQRLFSFENFTLFWERFGNLDFFFFFWFFLIYIHKQSTLDATWNFWIQRNIETWNKQTNFKLNHDIANLMWSEAKLGNLLLLGPFTMLETWYAWILIMIKCLGLALRKLQPWLWPFGICLQWLDLTLGRHVSCELLALDVDHVNTPSMGSSVGLRMIQETILGFHTK